MDTTNMLHCLGCGRVVNEITEDWIPIILSVKEFPDKIEGYACCNTCAAKCYLEKSALWSSYSSKKKSRAQLQVTLNHIDQMLETGFAYLRAQAARNGIKPSDARAFVLYHEALTVIATTQDVLLNGVLRSGFIVKWKDFTEETINLSSELD